MTVKYEKGKEANGSSSFEILKKVDISPHVEKKGNYDYVSWASALDILYSNFPKASYEVHTCQEGHPFFKSELGYYVVVSVTIDDKTETEYHAVTGNNNKALLKPTMVDINASIKRGLAKTIAQHGLGLDLWIGEDLQQYGKRDEEATTELDEASQEEGKTGGRNGNGSKPAQATEGPAKEQLLEQIREALGALGSDGNLAINAAQYLYPAANIETKEQVKALQPKYLTAILENLRNRIPVVEEQEVDGE
jgi:hypothetical protein